MYEMHLEGIGVTQDKTEALVWILKAAHQGLPQAQYSAGDMYLHGVGVSQDYPKAIVWLLKAANHNDRMSQHALGSLYLHGRGVPKNYLMAKEWFTQAATLGYEPSRVSLSKVQGLIDDEKSSSRLKLW